MPDESNHTPEHKPRAAAVAVKQSGTLPKVTASGYGTIAEQIVQMAFNNGVKVRTDPDLAQLLAKVEEDSPIPTEALAAVAEILAYIYELNGDNNEN